MPASAEEFPAWAKRPEDVLAHYGVDSDRGLSEEGVREQRATWGWNELDHEPATPLWKLVLQQFDDTLVKILLLAAVISFALAWVEEGDGESEGIRAFIEPAVILLILALNAVVGVWQEGNAESALEALKDMSADTARVWRDGHLIPDLPCRELVPGDVIEVHTGDLVPADARLLSLSSAVLRVEQAALTGESHAVAKSAHALAAPDSELMAKECMLFSGTGVSSGTCRAIVTATGMTTEIGRIQAQITAAAEEDDDTPLKKKLDEFGEALAQIILYVCVAVWLINYRHFLSWKAMEGSRWGIPDPTTVQFSLAKATFYFKVAVALAVAAIPEGLPAVITTCLALGTRKMAKRNAIVRKLPSVETLGCTTVICSDKTGTLTTNKMSAVQVVTMNGGGKQNNASHNSAGGGTAFVHAFNVAGTSFNPADGGVTVVDDGASSFSPSDACLRAVAAISSRCNGARLAVKHGHVVAVGQPTEAALLVLAEKLQGLSSTAESVDSNKKSISLPEEGELELPGCEALSDQLPAVAILEFDRDRKSMSVLCRVDQQNSNSAQFLFGSSADNESLVSTTTTGLRRSSRLAGSTVPSTSSNVLLVKGATECVLDRCSSALLSDGSVIPLDARSRAELDQTVAHLASRALRVLALAWRAPRDLPAELREYSGKDTEPGHRMLADPAAYPTIESGLCFAGLVALRDPPRPEVPGAIAACRQAGIRLVVITGDNKLTAESICADVGVFTASETVDDDDRLTDSSSVPEKKNKDYDHQVVPSTATLSSFRSLTGKEFSELSGAEKMAFLGQPGGLCISRAEPAHKQEIVRCLKDAGEIVAMTGDGVNDAPALKLADIGVAMGITGTEVAKEASDMVLADDNFATVVAAVEEGRSIFNNMKAFIRYMISSNIGEVASIFLSAALGLPEGLIPVQLLWVNLVTDGPPATALGFNPPDPDIMAKPPRRGNEHFLTPWLLFRWLVVGAYVGFATVGAFVSWYTSSTFLWGLIDLSGDGHTPVSLRQLQDWESCPSWGDFAASNYTAGGQTIALNNPCDYFTVGKAKASTLSLSVLVAIEMFNAANALSEDNSLVRVPVWRNPWLLVAMFVSFGLHFVILYVPTLASIFSIVPLSFNEWLLVLAYSLPVVLIDEVLKFIGRTWVNRPSTSPGDAKKLKTE